MGRKVGDVIRTPPWCAKKDRDCASKIDNAKDMTLPTLSLPTLHKFEPLTPLKK